MNKNIKKAVKKYKRDQIIVMKKKQEKKEAAEKHVKQIREQSRQNRHKQEDLKKTFTQVRNASLQRKEEKKLEVTDPRKGTQDHRAREPKNLGANLGFAVGGRPTANDTPQIMNINRVNNNQFRSEIADKMHRRQDYGQVIPNINAYKFRYNFMVCLVEIVLDFL